LVLSDSTVIRLNSETSLRYPVQFAGATRNVELIGEAYFEVKRNDHIPFVVTSGNQQVKVMGTEFNISYYPESENILTTLVEGKVEVLTTTNSEIKIELKPGQQSVLSITDGLISKRDVDVLPFIAWKDGRFLFHDQTLEEIMKTLSKWYNVEIDFSNNEDRKLRFTGNLKRSAEFKDILSKIELTNEVNFEINGNNININ
jgi:ferric-dicitrate binding protein FerR (iron transport regulator)